MSKKASNPPPPDKSKRPDPPPAPPRPHYISKVPYPDCNCMFCALSEDWIEYEAINGR